MPSAHRRHAEWTPTRLLREVATIEPSTIFGFDRGRSHSSGVASAGQVGRSVSLARLGRGRVGRPIARQVE